MLVTRRKLVISGALSISALLNTRITPKVFASDGTSVNIPITMCHGINTHLTLERFKQYLSIASDLGFSAINYDQLYAWLTNTGSLPERPIMFDFDHPVLSVPAEIFPAMQEYGYVGNLFVNTGYFDLTCQEISTKAGRPMCARWEQINELSQAGWTIGAHTHTHPNLSELVKTDPSGEIIRAEMEKNDRLIKNNLGLTPEYFAFTGNATGSTWSSIAAREAKKRYKLGRLWIIGPNCEADGKTMGYAELVNAAGADEADGGPPYASRYITKSTPFFKLPSMELQALIYEPDAFRQYLEWTFK